MKLTYLEVWAVHHLLAQQHLEMVRDCLRKITEQSESEKDGVLITSIQGASPVIGLLVLSSPIFLEDRVYARQEVALDCRKT